MKLESPLTHLEAEVAVWPADREGLPLPSIGDSDLRPAIGPCLAALSIDRVSELGEQVGLDGARRPLGGGWDVEIEAPWGHAKGGAGRVANTLEEDGRYVVVALWKDEVSGERVKVQFHGAAVASDRLSSGEKAMSRSVRFTAYHREELREPVADNDVEVQVVPVVEWMLGGKRMPALAYHGGAWVQTAEGIVGSSPRVDLLEASQAATSFVLNGLHPPSYDSMDPWFEVYHHDHANGAGLGLLEREVVADGYSELLRATTEPVLRFRVLYRTYASLGASEFVVPKFVASAGSLPAAPNWPVMHFSASGAVNPSSGFTGLHLYPDAAYVDGPVSGVALKDAYGNLMKDASGNVIYDSRGGSKVAAGQASPAGYEEGVVSFDGEVVAYGGEVVSW